MSLLKLGKLLWPHILLCNYQKDIVQSVDENIETFVVAGNMLGKDFIAAYIILTFFLSRNPCRIVTTSADCKQLESVLWGEIQRLIGEAKYNIDAKDGGPLLVNHLYIRKIIDTKKGTRCGLSYILGKVSKKGEGLLGHHIAERGDGIPRTLLVIDEASGVENEAYDKPDTWAKRKLIIGNPYPCTNFFYHGVNGGDIQHKELDDAGVV